METLLGLAILGIILMMAFWLGSMLISVFFMIITGIFALIGAIWNLFKKVKITYEK